MSAVVISQPMYFPWVGLFEQLRLADDYVHYDDVQFSKGSFTNRVQIKTAQGVQWLTVPLHNLRLGQSIREVAVDHRQNWQRKHLTTLGLAYAKAPFKSDMLEVVEQAFAVPADTIGQLAAQSMRSVHAYFDFDRPGRFHWASQMAIEGESSARVLAFVQALQGDTYITGHGARHYLDHAWFEREGVRVEYLDYLRKPYPQLHGEFTPFVSALDVIANTGKAGASVFCSPTVHWEEFLKRHE